MIVYTDSLSGIDESMLDGFFVEWPNPPTRAQHLRVLAGSHRVWLAIDDDVGKVVGFINAISDGALSAFIPLLEVLPEYQGNGIGSSLVARMLKSLEGFYMVGLLCDAELIGFYERLGMRGATGACLRNPQRI